MPTHQPPYSSEHGLDALAPHYHGFALMHRAMRRDAARLRDAAPAWRGGGAEWWQRLREVIEWHHTSEDDVLWPGLRRRDADFDAQARELHDDHEDLDTAMAAVTTAVTRGGEGLVRAARDFQEILHDHLRDEERVVFPVFDRMGERAYLAEERKVVASAPRRVLLYLQPWMFDGAGRESVAHVSATIPPPVRLRGATLLRRRYENTLKGLRK
ncbi:hemerythrin domain-containing protein [Streptomyces sp. NBC_00539]|uniref:hemerythrin domain-containing protein n=1 Tax=Streptomyces sp. NBC_00539 TaxID=2975770 RepID=UPI002E800D33|nr:hemerythrin domain-containing protein [Streptomyces sp. NBC_00539]WUC67864.1 hemerythrin domain-containing protein [Streptomyces sp. NBC_00539]